LYFVQYDYACRSINTRLVRAAVILLFFFLEVMLLFLIHKQYRLVPKTRVMTHDYEGFAH
jgi:hypothetical protein